MFGAGCAVVDAVVNSPAGNAATRPSPQRMAAIGRMFENQGHVAQAQMMYRTALKAEPGNLVARERLKQIAALKSERVFESTTRSTRQAIAAADSLKPPGRASKPQAATRETAEQLIVSAPDDSGDITVVALASVIGNDPVIKAAATTATTTSLTPEPVTASDLPIVAAALSVVSTETESDDAGRRGMAFAPAARLHVADTSATPAPLSEIDTVGYTDQGSLEANPVSLAAEWTAADRVVTVEQVANWMEAPQHHSDELFTALHFGENDGVKALAAVLLTEVSPDDERINQAIGRAAASGSNLLKVTALDALIQRGAITNEGIGDLLALLADGDPILRSQAASSLRNCADSEWAAQCVDGLRELLSDEDIGVVAMAASTLGDFGSHAFSVCGDLQRLAVEQNDPYILEAVSVALQRILNGHQGNAAVTLPPVDDSTPDMH